MEVPFDSQMNRTKNRVFVRGLIRYATISSITCVYCVCVPRHSPSHGVTFGVVAGLLGVSLLAIQVNMLTAAIGAGNILLYSMVYTPMKRISIVNTWVGSVVGALPPIMGWTAFMGSIGSGGLIMAAILYAWQFPHFNSLSWNHRGDYSRAGYQMMAVTNPGLCRRVALRYCFATIPICMMAPYCGLTTWWFAFDSLLVNSFLCYRGWQFYHNPNFQTSRRLFYFTLFHLPLLMAFLFLNKNSKKSEDNDKRTLSPL